MLVSNDNNNRREKLFLCAGIALVVLGFLINSWSVGHFFRPFARPITGKTNLLIIWSLQIFLIVLGAFFIVRRKALTLGKLGEYYRRFAAVVLGVMLLFAGLNLTMYSVNVIRTSFADADPVTQKYKIPLESFYPGMSARDIAKLLEETWSRKFLYDPFAQFKEKPYQGTFVNVDVNGFRHTDSQAAWPPVPDDVVVFVFGGSTTFNYGVSDEETIASHLQDALSEKFPRRKIAVYNFGRGFFYSSQERVLYEKLLVAGYVPDVAVFVDGLNDFNFYFTGDRPQFTPQLEASFTNEPYQNFLENLPVIAALRRLTSPASQGVQSSTQWGSEQQIQEVVDRYAANKRIIEKVSSAFGVKPIFVWQPISTYKYDLAYHPFSREWKTVGAGYGYPVMAQFIQKNNMGGNFLYLADIQETVKKPLYVDLVHYSGEMSKEIGTRIADFFEKTKSIR